MKHIIIAGPGRSGKTNISLHYSRTFHTHYKMDSIKRGLDNNFYSGSIPYYKSSSKMAHLIKTIIDECESDVTYGKEYYVIDTCHIYPSGIIEENLQDNIVVFIGYPNVSEMQKFREIRENDKSNIWTNKLSDEELLEYVREGILYSREIQRECEIYNLPFFDISSDFNRVISEIISYIDNNLENNIKLQR